MMGIWVGCQRPAVDMDCSGFPTRLSVLSAADKTVEQSRSVLHCASEGHEDPLACTSSLRIT